MSITYTQEAIDVLRGLEENLDSNRVYLSKLQDDKISQDIIDEIASYSYSMYVAALFIIKNVREHISNVLERLDALDASIYLDMVMSGFEINSLNETSSQTPPI